MATLSERKDAARKAAFAGHVADNPKIDWHTRQFIVHVLHDEDAFRRVWQVFTILFMAVNQWLVNLEVRFEVTDRDDAHVLLFHDASMRRSSLPGRDQ